MERQVLHPVVLLPQALAQPRALHLPARRPLRKQALANGKAMQNTAATKTW